MFSQLGLSPAVCSSLPGLGFSQPTPIQAKAIPLVLRGGDILARAQTGTGKTAAFGLPTIERLLLSQASRNKRPRALVLVPTRELASQVHQALSSFCASLPLRVMVVFGGVDLAKQTRALQPGADILVATPGRLLDHLQRRTIDLSGIEVLTLDEADRMLDMGFMPSLRRIAAALPRTRQTLLFSATISDEVARLAKDFTHEPARVDVSAGQTVAVTVTHQIHATPIERKADVLAQVLLEHGDQAIVFCKTKRGANRVGESLERRGIGVGILHGNKSQNARTRALSGFKGGRMQVLVATDIAARGLDIAQLPLVVNYELPLVAEDYVHRVGRTGRAGHPGRAVSLVAPAEAGLLRAIERLVAAPLERVPSPQVALPAQQPLPDRHREGDHAPRRRQAERPHASRPARDGAPREHRPGAPGARSARPSGHWAPRRRSARPRPSTSSV